MRFYLLLFFCSWSLVAVGQQLDDPEYFETDDLHPVWLEDWWVRQDFPDEEAIVTQDLCEVHFELYGRLPRVRYEYIRRVKILEEGSQTAASLMEWLVDRGDAEESLIGWKAVTYGLNAEGEVISFPVSKRDISESRKGSKTTYSVQFPFAKKGAVIEIRYEIRSENVDRLRRWTFQHEVPVVQSSVTTFIPYSYEYLVIPAGDLSTLQASSTEYRSNTPMNVFPEPARSRQTPFPTNTFTTDAGGLATTYMMIAVEPMEQGEAFAPEALDGYESSLTWELSRDMLRRQNNENLFESWDDFDKSLAKRFRFRKLSRKERKEVTALAGRRARNVRWVTIDNLYSTFSAFTWNGEYAAVPDNPGRTWKSRTGNSADINMLLLLALQEADIEAYPVLMSTRDHGYVQAAFPLLTQFNHMLVAVMAGGETVLLDAVGGQLKAGILPRNDLNGQGFLLNGNGGLWVPLQSYQKVSQVTYSRFTMQQDGSLNGEVSVVNKDFSKELESRRLEELNRDPLAYFQKYIWSGNNTLKLDNGRVEQVPEEQEALKMTWDVKMDEYVVKADGLYILHPMLMKTILSNPFSSTTRSSPVDLSYPIWEAHMLGLRIPEGYEVVQAPESIRVLMPGNAGQFVYNVMTSGNILHVTSSIQINRTRYSPEEYQGIRDFFEYIVKKHQEDIVIKKVE